MTILYLSVYLSIYLSRYVSSSESFLRVMYNLLLYTFIQACGWFGAGCFIGCGVCSNASSGAEVPSFPSMDYSTDWEKCQPMNPTLPDYARTYNIQGKSHMGDWTATHPWRAPGRAPMGDSCGNSGAYYIGK